MTARPHCSSAIVSRRRNSSPSRVANPWDTICSNKKMCCVEVGPAPRAQWERWRVSFKEDNSSVRPPLWLSSVTFVLRLDARIDKEICAWGDESDAQLSGRGSRGQLAPGARDSLAPLGANVLYWNEVLAAILGLFGAFPSMIRGPECSLTPVGTPFPGEAYSSRTEHEQNKW